MLACTNLSASNVTNQLKENPTVLDLCIVRYAVLLLLDSKLLSQVAKENLDQSKFYQLNLSPVAEDVLLGINHRCQLLELIQFLNR